MVDSSTLFEKQQDMANQNQADREASEQRRYNIEMLLQRYDCRER
jgi:hypothetical protein